MELTECLDFTGKVIDQHKFLEELSIYITLNINELTGLAGMEAILAGIPVVGIQLIEEYESSLDDWIYSSASAEELSKYVVNLADDIEMYEKVKNNQFRILNEKFSIGVMANRYLEVYSSALNN
jgi:glycosyltransferase involved in cell wall biosynthesis